MVKGPGLLAEGIRAPGNKAIVVRYEELAGFAQGYPGKLGRELITELGYDFEEPGNSLGHLAATTR